MQHKNLNPNDPEYKQVWADFNKALEEPYELPVDPVQLDRLKFAFGAKSVNELQGTTDLQITNRLYINILKRDTTNEQFSLYEISLLTNHFYDHPFNFFLQNLGMSIEEYEELYNTVANIATSWNTITAEARKKLNQDMEALKNRRIVRTLP